VSMVRTASFMTALRATRMASKGLRVVFEGSSMGLWESTTQANHRRTTSA
jgi:hypothetical protein